MAMKYSDNIVKIMSREDIETMNSRKSMMEIGQCPPLMVVYDSREGFTVKADRRYKGLTIITEYVGDVDFLENRQNYKGGSMITLLCASDPSKNLVICPDKRSNIARFINGINSHTQSPPQIPKVSLPEDIFLDVASAIRIELN